MIIRPIESTTPSKMSTQSQNYLGAESKEKRHKHQPIDDNIEWYCNNCNNYFAVPEPIKRRFHPIDGVYECKVPNCPYCSSENIINNREAKQEGKLWKKI